MEKGQNLKCISTRMTYLTLGKIYPVTAGFGDINKALGTSHSLIENHNSFNIVDDDGDILLQSDLVGSHGVFKAVK